MGCGRIGAGYDQDAPEQILTHASAIRATPEARLVALCDSDVQRARACAANRGVDLYFSDLSKMLERARPDILCIATPTHAGRLEQIQAAMAAGVKGIFCEKPLAADVNEALAIADAVPSDFPFAVNYQRSWSIGCELARSWVAEGRLGRILHIVVRYDKGFANNGSHAIDLLRHFVGWPTSTTVLSVRDDGRQGFDPTVDLACIWRRDEEDVPGYFISSDHRAHSVFEVELLGTKGRISFVDRGRTVMLEEVSHDAEYADFRTLQGVENKEGALDGAIQEAFSSLVARQQQRSIEIACTLQDALATMRVVDQVWRAVRGNV